MSNPRKIIEKMKRRELEQIVYDIFQLLDGKDWDSETTSDIADVFEDQTELEIRSPIEEL